MPSCVNCFTISNPTPLLPPATKTGDLPRYFEAIIVIDLEDALEMKAIAMTATAENILFNIVLKGSISIGKLRLFLQKFKLVLKNGIGMESGMACSMEMENGMRKGKRLEW